MAEQYKGISNKTFTHNTEVSEPNPRNTAQPQNQRPSTTASKEEDLVYNLVRREVNNSQSPGKGPRSYSRAERSAEPQATSTPVTPGPSSSCPPSSQASTSAATSSSQASGAMPLPSDNTRPEPGSQLHQPVSPNPKSADSADEIVELHSKAQDALAPQDKQSQAEGARQGTAEVSNIPNTNFAIACMVTLCFNLPFGILAMYFSLKAVRAFQEGHTKLGEKRSRWSIVCSLLGIAITTVIISSIVLYIAMQGQRRIKQYKAYSVKAGLSL